MALIEGLGDYFDVATGKSCCRYNGIPCPYRVESRPSSPFSKDGPRFDLFEGDKRLLNGAAQGTVVAFLNQWHADSQPKPPKVLTVPRLVMAGGEVAVLLGLIGVPPRAVVATAAGNVAWPVTEWCEIDG